MLTLNCSIYGIRTLWSTNIHQTTQTTTPDKHTNMWSQKQLVIKLLQQFC